MIALYVADTCEKCDISGIYPGERREYIAKVTNPQLKIQRISSWKLLGRAVRESFGFSLRELNFSLDESGKWTCDKLYFSLAHTDGKVAVAVSDKPVGVDIESFSAFEKRRIKPLSDKILCGGETAINNAELLKLWTQKESIFKCVGEGAFLPNKIHTAEYPVRTFENGDYCISVCGSGEDLADVNINILKL